MTERSSPARTFAASRVTLMGLGRHGGGVAAARWLVQQGALLTITDLASADELADSLAALADLPLHRLRLGEHRAEDFESADWIVVNPAVKSCHPLVQAAARRGVRITSETELFLHSCPATVIGVTGSNGKSTTAAMTAAILQAAGKQVWLGGNIGRSLLLDLPAMQPAHVVVLELSSFQLYYLPRDVRGPQVAVVTNCTPNHLDWHADYEEYIRSKQRLLSLQRPGDVAVLNLADDEVSRWMPLVRGKILPPFSVECIPALRAPGAHNRSNASLAAAAAYALGATKENIECALSAFAGLPHRFEFVAEIQDRRFFNDSKATTPEAAIAALNAIDAPVWILLGGSAKGGDYAALAAAVVAKARGVACFGQSATLLANHLRQTPADIPQFCGETLVESLRWCWQLSKPGDVILLSPACASFDQFRDYAHRGECFRVLVHQMGSTAR